MLRPAGDVVPSKVDAARVGDETPRNGIEKGRLTRSISADDDRKGLRLEIERDAL